MKILLVDDDTFLRDMYAMKFRESGESVEGARDGAQALSMVATGEYDVLITDMVMPGMTGSELIGKVRQTKEGKNLRCIVLSNQGEESDISEATKQGAYGYIIKAELIPSEVVARVRQLVT
jgi:DNA-binding response OmpR family regulator